MSATDNVLNISLNESDYSDMTSLPAPMIEYNFSWDETGMKLADLWIAFEIAFCEKKAALCQTELYTFIDTFIDVYQAWKPTAVDEDSFYNVQAKNVTGEYKHCIATETLMSIGLPFRFIRGFITWLKCMMSEGSEILDLHKIEHTIEILTRSPHNRVLLRYNHIEMILLNWLNKCSTYLSDIAKGTYKSLEDIFLTISNVIHIIYNFVPNLDSCSWLTIQGAFSSAPINLLSSINRVFGDFECSSLAGREECVIDCSWELVVIICKLKELIAHTGVEKKWVILFHQLVLITAGNITFLQSHSRASKVLHLLTKSCEGAGQWLFGKTPSTELSDDECMSLNVDVMILLMNVCEVSEKTRLEAYRCGCYELITTISY